MINEVGFLEPFVIDTELLNLESNNPLFDLTKKLQCTFHILKDDPCQLKEKDLKSIIEDKNSQIINKETYFTHIVNTSSIYTRLVEEIGSKNPDLNLPNPKIAKVWGWVHDLSAVYAKYNGKFKQYDKELTLFFHSKHLGIEDISNHVAMHCAYFELLEMIKEGKGFSAVGLYKGWTDVLNNPNHHFYFGNIRNEFDDFLKGQANLPLMILTVSDHIDNGESIINLDNLEKKFCSRSEDIEHRYYWNAIQSGSEPSPLGRALVERKGKQRIEGYFRIIKDLLDGKSDLYEGVPGMWRK